MVANSPHRVEVRIPAPTVTLPPNQEFKIAKAEPGGAMGRARDTALADGKLSAKVDSFSFFISVVVTYPLPIVQAVPFQYTDHAWTAAADAAD